MHLELCVLVTVLTLCAGACGAEARSMRATIYSDGASCPNNCDAHVVFDKSVNGTANAFRGSLLDRARASACVRGEMCTICFAGSDDSCMAARYRGNGPHKDAFDFTPAFYDENCGRRDLPATFAAKCRSMERVVSRLRNEHINCFDVPMDAKCIQVISAARQAKEQDRPYYDECRRLGEKAFNAKYKAQPQMLRRYDCAYSKNIRKGNSVGRTWQVLLPGACYENSYVGSAGLDCCTASLYAAAGLDSECIGFFPKR